MASPITADVVYEMTGVADPSLAADGSLLAFTQSAVDRLSMESRSRVLVQALPAGGARPFTSGPNDGTPRFSPDGSTLAFLRQDDHKRRQLWLIPTDGGEARQLTALPGGVAEYGWSPDGSALTVVSDVDPDQPPDDAPEGPRARVVRRIKYRIDTMGWRGDAHWHLFVVDAAGGKARQLTDGDWDDRTPAWSPDGTRIAFISHRRDDRDLTPFSEVYSVPAAGGTPERWSDDLSTIGGLTWSPDASRLAVIASDDGLIGAAWQGALFALAPGEPPRRLTPDSIRPAAGNAPVQPPPSFVWTPDGRVLFIGDSRGESHLWEVRERDGALRQVAGGGAQFTAIAFDGAAGSAAVVAAAPDSAGDLHLIDVASGAMQRLTEGNAAYFAEHPAARMEKFLISRGGLDIECRLLFPPSFDESLAYPLVLDIHGVSHSAFADTFNATQQVLATAGYLVLLVNPRGSSTYGDAFVKAVLGDWGGEDYLDIMAAVDEVCTRSYVDASRLGVHGYSYGGFMSAWAIGHDTRFGAAVIGAPCINLSSMYGTSDIGVSFGEMQWGGQRHEAEEAYRAHSPLTYAPNVRTPALLLHGEADDRCPIEQSEQYFVALKRLGNEVEFVRLPGCSHLFMRLGDPKMREEYLARTLAWVERYLGHGAAAPTAATAAGKGG